MAKTNFEYGTVVPQEFLNTIYGQGVNGGHVHDGVDKDGHAKKVSLDNAAEVSGVLPLANQASHVHDGTERSKIDLVNHVTGSLPLANQANHVHDGEQRDRIHPYHHLEGVGVSEFDATFSEFSSPIVVKFRLFRFFDPTNAKPEIYKLLIPAFSGVSNSQTLQAPGTNFPWTISSLGSITIPVFVINNGDLLLGSFKIDPTTGNISFGLVRSHLIQTTFLGVYYSVFTASGTKGVPQQLVDFPFFPPIWPVV
jgi:hypothetical protein